MSTWPEYACKVSVEIALYFELHNSNKFVAVHMGRLLSEICLFCIAQDTKYFPTKFLPYI
jgi:hypothetical protein